MMSPNPFLGSTALLTARFASQALLALFFIVGVMLIAAPAKAEQAVYTTPRGIYTVKVPGTPDPAVPVRTYLGIQLLPDTGYYGQVGTVTGNSFTLWLGGDLSHLEDPARTNYVHVMDGSGSGFVVDIDHFTSNAVICSEDLTPWIQAGTRIRIRSHSHLSDLLGAANRYGLGAGPDAESADNVVIWDPQAQQEKVYYFHSIRARWEERGVEADASHAIFRFPYGFYIIRRSPGTLRIVLSGEIGSDSILLPVRTGANVFSLPVNLSASLENLVSSDGNFSVTRGPNATTADILTFEEPTHTLHRGPFYHSSRPEETGWLEVGVDDSTSPIAPLDFLSTLIVRRTAGPSRVLVSGNIDTPSVPPTPLPPDPEAGEIPLTATLSFDRPIPPGASVAVEVSTDLQTWSTQPSINFDGHTVTFQLPPGQGRAFYRLKATISF